MAGNVSGLTFMLTEHIAQLQPGGPPGIIPGATTAGLLCSVLQLGYNELRVWRVRYVTRQTVETSPNTKPQRVAPSDAATGAEETPTAESRTPFHERFVLPLFGVKRVSTEEALARLIKQRDETLRRIAELEAEADKDATESNRTES